MVRSCLVLSSYQGTEPIVSLLLPIIGILVPSVICLRGLIVHFGGRSPYCRATILIPSDQIKVKTYDNARVVSELLMDCS